MSAAGLVLDGELVVGLGSVVHTADPATGARVGDGFATATEAQLDAICAAAVAAQDALRRSTRESRAALLDAIAAELEARAEGIVAIAVTESGLAEARIRTELGRTTGQLRMFSGALRDGTLGHTRRDEVAAGDATVPLRLRTVPVGPVAVFAASNFPLAFSTAGGDTASALAAGCPVIVKAHSAHVGTSVAVAEAIAAAVTASGLPAGTFGHVIGGREIGMGLVGHAGIRAVGFTGSRAGGLALARAAAERPHPIPVFAEMSSVNPVFLLPGGAAAEVADGFVASLSLGAGQFCTNPGLVLVPRTPGGDAFAARAAELVGALTGQTMLTEGIAGSFRDATSTTAGRGAARLAEGTAGAGPNAPAAALFEIDAAALLDDPAWQDEMFGAAGVLVRYDAAAELPAIAESLDGQLTATVWHGAGAPGDDAALAALLPVLERRAGRLIANGWPTGVAVSPAMVHGGPSPATTDARFTAVGTLAVERFLRPVSYQGFADERLAALLGVETAVSHS